MVIITGNPSPVQLFPLSLFRQLLELEYHHKFSFPQRRANLHHHPILHIYAIQYKSVDVRPSMNRPRVQHSKIRVRTLRYLALYCVVKLTAPYRRPELLLQGLVQHRSSIAKWPVKVLTGLPHGSVVCVTCTLQPTSVQDVVLHYVRDRTPSSHKPVFLLPMVYS